MQAQQLLKIYHRIRTLSASPQELFATCLRVTPADTFTAKHQNEDIMGIFTGRTLLITGGTGSFGNAVLRRFIDCDVKESRISSCDEKKQDDMRHLASLGEVKRGSAGGEGLQVRKQRLY